MSTLPYLAKRPDYLEISAIWNAASSRHYTDITWAIWEVGAKAEKAAQEAEVGRKGVVEALETLRLINELREDEACHVTIVNDNPDFNGMPNCLIYVMGPYTDYKETEFRGDTLVETLRKAVEAKNRYVPKTHRNA
jgi:hypothetical protein